MLSPALFAIEAAVRLRFRAFLPKRYSLREPGSAAQLWSVRPSLAMADGSWTSGPYSGSYFKSY